MLSNVFSLLFGGAFLCACIQLGSAYYQCDDIQDFQLADVDPVWYKEAMEKGFYVVEQGHWAYNRSIPTPPERSESLSESICYLVNGRVLSGVKVQLPLSCKYNHLKYQECEKDFIPSASQGIVQWNSYCKLVSTDNQTYLAGTTCVFGQPPSYWIMSTTDKPLSPALLTSLDLEFEKVGFLPGKKSGKEEVLPIFVDTFALDPNCS